MAKRKFEHGESIKIGETEMGFYLKKNGKSTHKILTGTNLAAGKLGSITDTLLRKLNPDIEE